MPTTEVTERIATLEARHEEIDRRMTAWESWQRSCADKLEHIDKAVAEIAALFRFVRPVAVTVTGGILMLVAVSLWGTIAR